MSSFLMYTSQLNMGLPFEVKIPAAKSVDVLKLSEAELNAELEKGYVDMTADRTKHFPDSSETEIESEEFVW